MRLSQQDWNIEHLRGHLQAAVDLELWTIPFYMSAMYSVLDRTSGAFQLIQTVVNQEMLHVQLAANVANAFGLSPSFRTPVYAGTRIPHLDFKLDTPDPRPQFSPYSAEIGPLDTERVNAMCLIEYPEWETGHAPDLRDDVTEYGSIGEFYDAVQYGAGLLKQHLHGGVNQVDHFSAFYANLPSLKVTESGDHGLRQVNLLFNIIRDQGEGASLHHATLPAPYQNTADDTWAALSHFSKFQQIRDCAARPLVYPLKVESDLTEEDRAVRDHLAATFAEFRAALERLFSGRNPGDFVPLMMSVGAGILNCWRHGVTPRFD
jgi:hypothetical protein